MNVYMKEPNTNSHTCVIWMHGLGANAQDMMSLSDQLLLNDLNVRHVFLDAPSRPVTLNGGLVMPAWYDILGMKLADREDEAGIIQSTDLIRSVINEQLKAGFSDQQIFLAGFSQGGAMAIYTALHYQGRLGGVIALSAYLPLAQEIKPLLDKHTPFFMASGQFDPIVLPAWTQQSQVYLDKHGYQQVAMHTYPMEHSVCYEELKDLSLWLIKHAVGEAQ